MSLEVALEAPLLCLSGCWASHPAHLSPPKASPEVSSCNENHYAHHTLQGKIAVTVIDLGEHLLQYTSLQAVGADTESWGLPSPLMQILRSFRGASSLVVCIGDSYLLEHWPGLPGRQRHGVARDGEGTAFNFAEGFDLLHVPSPRV